MKKRSGISRPVGIASLVEYSGDSIVSRTIVEGKSGTVTAFAFAAGQGLSEHSAPFDALVQVVEGEGVFTVGGRKATVSAGEILLMPANIPHAVEAKIRFKMLLTMIFNKK